MLSTLIQMVALVASLHGGCVDQLEDGRALVVRNDGAIVHVVDVQDGAVFEGMGCTDVGALDYSDDNGADLKL